LLREWQSAAIAEGHSDVAHWGPDVEKYVGWSSHSMRLVPVYTFGTANAAPGGRLADYQGTHSVYRDEAKLRSIYGYLPENSVNPEADYLDNTNIAELQRAALAGGRKYIFLVIFDGMDWQTTEAAAIYASGDASQTAGRGHGLHFLDYTADGTTEFGAMVTAPHNEGTKVDVNLQKVLNPGGAMHSGYNAAKAGPNPWTPGADPNYLISTPGNGYGEHTYADSAATATAMTSGVKTYNDVINRDAVGEPVETVAHEAQALGYAVGAVSSVPISHATPAAAYAHNVSRDDYQDLSRDMLGQPSVSHPDVPLSGLDVVLGGGYGVEGGNAKSQGDNYIKGWAYIAQETIDRASVENGGRYTVVERTPGRNGSDLLRDAAGRAAEDHTRLLGLFGLGDQKGHLPFQTADGDYHPTVGKSAAETYTEADLSENPTLADMTTAAIQVLSARERGFWLMVEAGDVDWANHDNNLDNSIGAVFSGDAAVRAITDWVEANSNWDESLLIVTADHGHYLNIDRPGKIAQAGARSHQTTTSQTGGR